MNNDINIIELLQKGTVLFDVEGNSPKEVYKNVVDKIEYPKGLTPENLYTELCQREELMSTAVGNGISLPHSRYPILKNSDDQRIIVCYLKKDLQMNAPDGRLVSTMFILLTSSPQFHLKVLSQLAFLFQNKDFRTTLENKPNQAELLEAVKKVF
jgi:PTS system nitrogen regulatory IIA component